MYIFEAHYINIDTDGERTKKIELDGQYFDTTKEVYVAAMNIACEMMNAKEILLDLEFILR